MGAKVPFAVEEVVMDGEVNRVYIHTKQNLMLSLCGCEMLLSINAGAVSVFCSGNYSQAHSDFIDTFVR